MKPKNLFRLYADAVERLDRRWFGKSIPDYKTDIAARAIPQSAIGILIVLFVACSCEPVGLIPTVEILLESAVIVLCVSNVAATVWHSRTCTRKLLGAGEWLLPLAAGILYTLAVRRSFFLYEFLLNGGNFSGIHDYAILPKILRIACIGIWLHHLCRHAPALPGWGQRLLYALFSWVTLVAGTQLFGIAMVFGYLLYLVGWGVGWLLFILFFGGKGRKRSSYELEDGTRVEKRTGLFGDESYRGSDGSDYTTSDGGETFSKR